MELPREEVQEYSQRIVEQADRMVHIINHVRLFARDAGNVDASLVDLNQIVDASTTLIKAQFSSHGLLLETDLADQPLRYWSIGIQSKKLSST